MIKKTRIAFLLSGFFASSLMASNHDININSLHYATSINEADYVRELVQDEPNLASQFNKEGLTPVHMAIKKSSLTSLAVMLEEKINPNIKNSLGETALIYAIKNGHPKAAELLLNSGAKVKIKDKTGKTAEDYARLKGTRYINLFKKEDVKLKKTDFANEKIITLKDFEKYQEEISSIILSLNKENKKIIGDMELKMITMSSDLKLMQKELSLKESENKSLKLSIKHLEEELKGTDLSLLDAEQKIEKVSTDTDLLRKGFLKIDSKTEVLLAAFKKYKRAQMIQMHGTINEKEEGNFGLIGMGSESSKVEQDEDEINFIDLGESKKVEVVEKEDEIVFIK